MDRFHSFECQESVHYGLPPHQSLLETLTSESWNGVSFISTVLSTVARQDNLTTFSLISFHFPLKSWK